MALSNEEKREIIEELKRDLEEAKKVYIQICKSDIEIPQYANIGDAGMDIRAAEDVLILPGETKIIPTGIKVAIPEGYELQVRPRSGASLKTPLRIANSPGTIDSGYRDEVGIIVSNASTVLVHHINQNGITGEITFNTPDYSKSTFYSIDEKGNKSGAYLIKKGDRIAQIVLGRVETIEFESVEDVRKIGSNRGGGFGSTGTK